MELSGARGVSRLRRCNGFCTLRLYLPADWAQKNIMAKNLSRQIQNSCERFVLHVFLGLSRQRAGPMAHAWTSTRLRFLLLGDVISSHLPASLAVGMAVGMAGAAAPPACHPWGSGCGLLTEKQAEQQRKWLLKQAANVEAPPSTCLHNY